MHLLFTGKPRVGKTTLIKKLIEGKRRIGGFYTEEIKEKGRRIGFKIITLDGKKGVLAKKDFRSKYKLGSYGINIDDLEKIGVGTLKKCLEDKNIETVIIDEIGRMELFSGKFKGVVLKVLESQKRILGTIHRADIPFLKKIKQRKDVKVIEVTRENRDELLGKAKDLIF